VRPIADRPFGFVAVVYFAAVLLYWHHGWLDNSPDRNYVAARELVSNHRIVAADLQRPHSFATSLGFYLAPKASIVGKYVKIKPSIGFHKPITDSALADKPDMQLPDKIQAVAFPLPVGSFPVSMLDVDTAVLLLGKDAEAKSSISVTATVHAIICEVKKADTESCYPVLRISADKSELVTKNQSSFHIALPSQVHP
jgi:hypothetical protein